MFLNKTRFKKWMKNAYQNEGLTAGMIYGGLVLSGAGWIAWTEKGYIPNWVKAAVIELVGELPKEETVFKAQKNELLQYEIGENPIYDLPLRFLEASVPFWVTPVTYQSGYNTYRLLQNCRTKRIYFLAEGFYEIFDLSELTQEEGSPVGPSARDPEGEFLYWKSAHAALAVRQSIEAADRHRIREHLETINFQKEGD